MTVFGVDLGTRRVALACPQYGFAFRADTEKTAGKRDYPTEVDAGRALGALCRSAVLSAGIPLMGMEFWYERPLAHMNIKTAIGQSLSAGALLTQLPGSNHQVSNSTWKKELIGHGRADGAQYLAWLAEHHPALASLHPEDEDVAAACCIALWAGMVAGVGL